LPKNSSQKYKGKNGKNYQNHKEKRETDGEMNIRHVGGCRKKQNSRDIVAAASIKTYNAYKGW